MSLSDPIKPFGWLVVVSAYDIVTGMSINYITMSGQRLRRHCLDHYACQSP